MDDLMSQYQEIRAGAHSALSCYLSDFPQLSDIYLKWKNSNRLNTVAITAIMAEKLYLLEGIKPGETDMEKVYLAAAAACISDDLVDIDGLDYDSVSFLDKSYGVCGSGLWSLYSAFHSALESLLPGDFKNEFDWLISEYNGAQKDSLSLKDGVAPEIIIDVKNRVGGYSYLLLHRIMFPDMAIDSGVVFSYSPESCTMPASKDQALYNFGCMISRLDDLSDVLYDMMSGDVSLATENLVTIESVRSEIDYVFDGLGMFYDTGRIEALKNIIEYTYGMIH